MSTGDDVPDRRERCGRLQPVPCGDWDEDHEDQCRYCDGSRADFTTLRRCDCSSLINGATGKRIQVLCPDGKGEFERAVRPSHDD